MFARWGPDCNKKCPHSPFASRAARTRPPTRTVRLQTRITISRPRPRVQDRVFLSTDFTDLHRLIRYRVCNRVFSTCPTCLHVNAAAVPSAFSLVFFLTMKSMKKHEGKICEICGQIFFCVLAPLREKSGLSTCPTCLHVNAAAVPSAFSLQPSAWFFLTMKSMKNMKVKSV